MSHSASGRRMPPNTEGMVSLKVDNLTYRTTPDMLKRVFEKYGDVGDVYIPRDPYSQDSRGFAFVRYFDERDADDAIEALNGTMMDGRELRVQLAKHARPPQSSSFSRRSAPSSSSRRGRRSNSRSRSRSRDRRRRRSRSHSRSGRRDRRERSRSGDRRRNRSRSRSDSKSPRRSRSPQNNHDSKPKAGGSRSRSNSPPVQNADHDRSHSPVG